MLTTKKIKQLFEKLNTLLSERSEIGEIGIVGGAVMCLVYNTRVATKDVDAVFAPSKIIRQLASQLAKSEGLTNDWLNDSVKGFLVPNFEKQEVFNMSNLRIWAPDAKYMLALKCLSARWDSHDKDDVIFLIKHLNLTKANQIFSIIENYYPNSKILVKTGFFIEEVLENINKN